MKGKELMKTTIPVTKTTRKRLKKTFRKDETYDEGINRLLDEKKEVK